MPIRLNLLAEAQAAEEMKRKDPVKRAILFGVVLIALVMTWSAFLQIHVMTAQARLSSIKNRWTTIEKGYKSVVDVRRKLIELEQRMAALQNLTTNRFLYGPVLNELQRTLDGVNLIQTVRIRSEHTYATSEEVAKAKPESGRGAPARTAAATEKIVLMIDAKDYSQEDGSEVEKFRAAIANSAYFQSSLSRSNGVLLTSLSGRTVDPTDENRSFVSFSFQCTYPDKVRRSTAP